MKSRAADPGTLQAGPFVSYARKDQPFVRRLHEALQRRQRDTWVDWEGIYPTEEWMARIRAAIDAAQAFVFVISPDSVASGVCRQEIEHAVAQGKRIIPILAKDVDATAVHPAVAKLNWLTFREADDFDAQVDALLGAMDLDIDWLRAHTRLLVRAEEWQKRDRDGSLLLRGKDLQEAEHWLLAANAAAKRVPTPIQTQFIVAGRQADTRRRKVQRTIGATAIVVLSALSIYAWMQKTVAERQRNLAVSRQLAARVQSLDTDDTLTRLLLSTLATRYSHSSEADGSLARSLLPTVPLQKVLWSPSRGDSMPCLAFHRSGAYLAGSNTHGVTIWQVATGRVEAFFASDDGVDCVTFGARDDLVAIADEGRAILWEWRTDRRRTLGGDPNETTTRAAFTADDRAVYVASQGQVRRWDVANGTSQEVIAQASSDPTYAFSADGTRLASADDSQRITVWDLQTGQSLIEVQGPEGAGTALAFATDGRTLAAGRNTVMVWDLDGQAAQLVNQLDSVAVTALSFSANGETIAVVGNDGGVLQWDFRRRRQRLPLAGPKYSSSVVFSPDDALLATDGGLGTVRLWRRAAQFDHILQRKSDVELASEESAMNGAMLGLKRGRGYVLWDPTGTRPPIDVVDFPERWSAIQVSSQGNVLALLDGDRQIRLWDAGTGQPLRQIKPPAATLERLDLSPTGGLVAGVGIDGDIVVADTRSGRIWSQGADATGHARSIAFSPDGTRLASGGLEGVIHVWDAASGAHAYALQNGTANVLSLAFSPDGTRLAANAGADIVLWDVPQRTVRRTLRDHNASVTGLTFSPDGARLASASLDRTAKLWDPVTGEVVFTLNDTLNAREMIGVAFSADGRTLATRSASGTVSLWDVDSDHWSELACAIVNRNPTREEWERFLPSEAYRPACPAVPGPAASRSTDPQSR